MHATRKNKAKGFTLVEILIVVVILGILAAIVVPQFTNDVRELGRFLDREHIDSFRDPQLMRRLFSNRWFFLVVETPSTGGPWCCSKGSSVGSS